MANTRRGPEASRKQQARPRSRRPSASRTSERPSRQGSSYLPGRTTRAAIVRAAEDVLIESGYARFTVLRVAEKLGISPGNVNYYFPTKASLLEALISFTLMQYRRRVRTSATLNEGEASRSLTTVLLWLMDDAASDRTSRLFRELWAISLTDAHVARAMDEFYARSVRAHLRRAKGPSTAKEDSPDLETIVWLIHVISEGITVLFGTRTGSKDLYRRVRAAARDAIAQLLSTAQKTGSAANAESNADS